MVAGGTMKTKTIKKLFGSYKAQKLCEKYVGVRTELIVELRKLPHGNDFCQCDADEWNTYLPFVRVHNTEGESIELCTLCGGQCNEN